MRVRGSPISLWCEEPSGLACERVSVALGVMPVPPSEIPAELLSQYRDEPNDCAEPELRAVAERLAGPLGLDPNAWADQIGSDLPLADLAERYVGGGCITMANPALPTVKIHASAAPGSRLVLVRVWERDSPPP